MYCEEPFSGDGLSDINVGFILTRQRREIKGVLYIEYWLLTDSGPVSLITPPQREVFFVRQLDSKPIVEQLNMLNLPFELKPLSLKTFNQEKVAALYFVKGSCAYTAKLALSKALLPVFESDIRLPDRYLMERFIYGSASFTGTQSSSDTFNNAQLKASQYSPVFRVLSIDIECSEKGELYSVGLAADDYRCVLMIGEHQKNAPAWILWLADEKALLQAFVAEVVRFDPDIFVGWNVINFDFRLLIQRAHKHGVLLSIGRGHNNEIRWRSARGEVNKGYVSMPGRVVIDGIDALKTATYHFDSFSLESVSRQLLGKGKKLGEGSNAIHVDDRMAAINHDFKHNKVKLAEYNLQDCTLVLDIFSKTQLLSFLIFRTQITGLELDKLGGSVAAFLNLYLPKLHRAGYISPNRPDGGGLASPGGYVMESRPGLYKHILVLDFKSLYPSIIRTFKIDPLGLVEGLRSPSSGVEGYKGAVFSRTEHFLPSIITELWQQRDEAKRCKDTARSQAIKILMNSFYGVLGSGGCPFYDTRLASSITMRGHDIMKATAAWIEEQGYEVIYGDTDSTFVWVEGLHSDQDVQKIGLFLQNHINKLWSDKIEQEFGLPCYLELEFETHYTQFLMPTIRGSHLGSKKRYAGIKYNGGEGELIFKGLETVRSDWTELAKTFQFTLYQMVFSGLDVKEYILGVVEDIKAGRLDAKLVYRKRLRRPLTHYVKSIPPHVKAARFADAINLKLGRNLQYQHKGWISYVVTLNGPQPMEYIQSPLDYEHYIEKQVRSIADGILPFIDVSFGQMTDSQLSLFTEN